MEHNLAYLDGWFAHKGSVSGDDNPYNERTQPVSHGQWMSGWCKRFGACQHDGDLSLDDEY